MTRRLLALLPHALLPLVACHPEDEETGDDTAVHGDPAVVYTPGDCFVPIDGATCGTVTVPARHGSGSADTLTLSVAVLPASSGAVGTVPLALFNGGPGSSIFDLAPLFERRGLMAPLLVDHDIVLMSERGTPGSTPTLDCPELADVDALFAAQAADRATATLDAWAACHDRLVNARVDLAAYTNAERAADVPQVLTALGYDRWHLWGVSGGALLVQRVMRDFPEGLVSAHVDSGGFPTAHMHDIPVQLVANASERFRRMFDECAADATCNAAHPDLEANLATLVASLDTAPVPFTITHPTTGATGVVMLDGDTLVQLLTNNFASIAYLPMVIDAALLGDYTLIEPVLPYAFVSDTGESFADGMYESVFCADVGPMTLADVHIDGTIPHITEALLPPVDQLLQSCGGWGVPYQPPDAPFTSDIPILIMEGMYDTNRPPEWGRAVATNDPAAWLAEFPNHAHVVLDECAVSMMVQVMADPTTAPDMSCIPAGVDWAG